MANHCQEIPHLSLTIYIQNDYNAILKIYMPFSHGYTNIYITKIYLINNKGRSYTCHYQSSTKRVPKRGLDSVDDFDFDTSESDS